MGRAMAWVLIVAIIAVAALLFVRSINRTAERRKNLSNALLELNEKKTLLNKLYAELNMQISTNYYDPKPLQDMLNDHLRKDITT